MWSAIFCSHIWCPISAWVHTERFIKLMWCCGVGVHHYNAWKFQVIYWCMFAMYPFMQPGQKTQTIVQGDLRFIFAHTCITYHTSLAVKCGENHLLALGINKTDNKCHFPRFLEVTRSCWLEMYKCTTYLLFILWNTGSDEYCNLFILLILNKYTSHSCNILYLPFINKQK